MKALIQIKREITVGNILQIFTIVLAVGGYFLKNEHRITSAEAALSTQSAILLEHSKLLSEHSNTLIEHSTELNTLGGKLDEFERAHPELQSPKGASMLMK